MELISSANGMSPAWSPDGRRIAFLSNRAEGWDLYVMSSGGGEPIRLTSGATADDPAWHPDGERIAIERGGAIELVRPDGGGREILVERASQPAWSADGRLAFRGNGDLWLRAADGDEARMLVDATEPAWSPDGERLAVVRHGGISVLDLASDTTHELTRASGDHAPVWGPSGNRISFVRRDTIFEIGGGGGEAAPVVGLPSPAGGPAFAASGELLAFHLHQGGNWNIAIADLQTGATRLLTEATWISWNARV